MTDEQKIEKLAKWMGFIYSLKCADGHIWNPLANIADAWMLVGKAQELGEQAEKNIYSRRRVINNLLGLPIHPGFLLKTAAEAARDISEAVLEVIE